MLQTSSTAFVESSDSVPTQQLVANDGASSQKELSLESLVFPTLAASDTSGHSMSLVTQATNSQANEVTDTSHATTEARITGASTADTLSSAAARADRQQTPPSMPPSVTESASSKFKRKRSVQFETPLLTPPLNESWISGTLAELDARASRPVSDVKHPSARRRSSSTQLTALPLTTQSQPTVSHAEDISTETDVISMTAEELVARRITADVIEYAIRTVTATPQPKESSSTTEVLEAYAAVAANDVDKETSRATAAFEDFDERRSATTEKQKDEEEAKKSRSELASSPVALWEWPAETSHISLTLGEFDALDATRWKLPHRSLASSAATSPTSSSYVTVASSADSDKPHLTKQQSDEAAAAYTTPLTWLEVETPRITDTVKPAATKYVTFIADDDDDDDDESVVVDRRQTPFVWDSSEVSLDDVLEPMETIDVASESSQLDVAHRPQTLTADVSTWSLPPSIALNATDAQAASSPVAVTETSPDEVEDVSLSQGGGVERKSVEISHRVSAFLPSLPSVMTVDSIADDESLAAVTRVPSSPMLLEDDNDIFLPDPYAPDSGDQEDTYPHALPVVSFLDEDPTSQTLVEIMKSEQGKKDLKTLVKQAAAASVNVDDVNDKKWTLEPKWSLSKIINDSLREEKRFAEEAEISSKTYAPPADYDLPKTAVASSLTSSSPPTTSVSDVVFTLSDLDDSNMINTVGTSGVYPKDTSPSKAKTSDDKKASKGKTGDPETRKKDGFDRKSHRITFVEELLDENRRMALRPPKGADDDKAALSAAASRKALEVLERRCSATLLATLNRGKECVVDTGKDALPTDDDVDQPGELHDTSSKLSTASTKPTDTHLGSTERKVAEFWPASATDDGDDGNKNMPISRVPSSQVTVEPASDLVPAGNASLLKPSRQETEPAPYREPADRQRKPPDGSVIYISSADMDTDEENVARKISWPEQSTVGPASSALLQVPSETTQPRAARSDLHPQDSEITFTLQSYDKYDDSRMSYPISLSGGGRATNRQMELPSSSGEPDVEMQKRCYGVPKSTAYDVSTQMSHLSQSSMTGSSKAKIARFGHEYVVGINATNSALVTSKNETRSNKDVTDRFTASDVDRVSGSAIPKLTHLNIIKTSTPTLPEEPEVDKARGVINEAKCTIMMSPPIGAETNNSGSRASSFLTYLNKRK